MNSVIARGGVVVAGVAESGRRSGTWRPHLDHANEVRLARARVKRELKSGARTLADAMGDSSVQTMKVMDLLAYLPGQGRLWTPGNQPTRADAQAVRIIRRAGMIRPEKLTVEGLSPARRRVICEAVATIAHLRDQAGVSGRSPAGDVEREMQ